MVVVSAFAGSYHPTPGTVIGALSSECDVDVRALARTPEYDLRQTFGLWISHPLSECHFGRLMCVELEGSGLPPEDVVENVFVGLSILEAKGVEVRSMAMPMIGAGLQRIRPETIMPALIPAAKRALERSSCLQRVLFVENNSDRAAQLDIAMNQTLGRVKVVLPKSELIGNLRKDILTALDRVRAGIPEGHQALVTETHRLLSNPQAKSFEIGILGRRLAEFVTDDILIKTKTNPDLLKKIDLLAEKGIAGWILSYLHTLRILGNESGHEKDTGGRFPKSVAEGDLAVCLFCIQRVLTFWEDYRKHKRLPAK